MFSHIITRNGCSRLFYGSNCLLYIISDCQSSVVVRIFFNTTAYFDILIKSTCLGIVRVHLRDLAEEETASVKLLNLLVVVIDYLLMLMNLSRKSLSYLFQAEVLMAICVTGCYLLEPDRKLQMLSHRSEGSELQKQNSGPIPFEPLVLEDLLRYTSDSMEQPPHRKTEHETAVCPPVLLSGSIRFYGESTFDI